MAKNSGISDDKALMLFKEALTWSRDQYNTKHDEWRENYEDTFVFKNKPAQTIHNFFVPKIYEVVQNVMPRLVGSNPRFVVTPRGKRVEKDKIESLKDFVEKFEWKRMKMKSKVREIALSMSVYGTSFALVEWKEEPIMVWNRKKKQNVEEGTIGMNNVSVIDIHDIFFDYRNSDIQDSPFVIYVKRNVSKAQIEDLGFNVENIPDMSGRNGETAEENDKNNKFEQQGFNDPSKHVLGRDHDLWYFYTNNDKGEPVQIAVVDEEFVVSNTMNPFPHGKYPVVKFLYEEKSGEGYGTGLASMLKSIQDILNHTRNMRMDNVLRGIVGRWLVDLSRGNIDLGQFLDMSKHVITGNDVSNSIIPVQTPNVTGNAYNETQQLETDVQTLTGVNNFVQTGVSGFNDTATGARILSQNSNLRINNALENLEEGLSRLGEMIIQNNLAFQSEDTLERIDQDGEPFNLEDFQFPFDIAVESGSTNVQMDLKEQEEAAIFLNSLTPFAQAGVIQLKPILDKFLNSYNIKNQDEFFAQEEAPEGPQEVGPGGPQEQAAPDMKFLDILTRVSRGEDEDVNPEDSEGILQALQLMAETPEFQSLNPESRNRVLRFGAEHQALLTQQA